MTLEIPDPPRSKVLVLEPERAHRDAIGAFCRAHHLQGHKVRPENILSVLESNIDLGAIFLPEKLGEDPRAGHALGRRIHALRPELPLFLRTEEAATLDALPQDLRPCFAGAYRSDAIGVLDGPVRQLIFSLAYPPALVRGVAEITRTAFESQFKGLEIGIDPPYIVRDRLIFGEVFSLIPIESDWCRGYLTMQAEEAALERLVRADRTFLAADAAGDFRGLNGILSELTNLVWGGFKNRFGHAGPLAAAQSQVPIVVNHLHRYISFGSADPQLCLRCTLRMPQDPGFAPVVVYQRFVFSLGWTPEAFHENDCAAASLVASGDLELF
ncbi:MAG: chemotaxis protein CheX [Xylophilus ampelinus]